MPYIAVADGFKIYYEDKGEGKPVVLLHGWSSNRLRYGFTVPEISEKFRVITYDHRGHGVSDRPEYGLSMRRLAGDLEELMSKLELKEVTLVGWSMGAHVLFEYTKTFGTGRLEKAVIVDMSPKLINEDDWNMGLYHGDFDHKSNLEVLGSMCEDWDEFAEKFIKEAAPGLTKYEFKLALKDAKTNTPHVMYALWIAMTMADYRGVLSNIDVPTLIMYGEESTLYSSQTAYYMGERIPSSRIMKFENCSHMLVLEKPAEFNKALEDFILE